MREEGGKRLTIDGSVEDEASADCSSEVHSPYCNPVEGEEELDIRIEEGEVHRSPSVEVGVHHIHHRHSCNRKSEISESVWMSEILKMMMKSFACTHCCG